LKPVSDVNLIKQNESSMLIESDSGIARELVEFFSFYVPGYKFMPAYRNKVWDGKIRLMNMQTRELPIGLLTYVMNFCSSRGYKLTCDPELTHIEKVTEDELNKFIDSLFLPFDIRDYQFAAVKKALTVRRVIALSPTGSGKSLIIYTLMRYLLENTDSKVLIIVPTTSLVEQMAGDFVEYAEGDHSFDASSEIHKIYSGKPKTNLSERVVISTWQSVYKLPKTWYNQFVGIFGDEVHGFKSKSLTGIMNKAEKTIYRIGTTGTLDGTQTHKLVLEGLFGRVFNVTTTRDLQDNDTLAKLNITCIKLTYPDEIRKDVSSRKYQDEIDFIVGYEKRNKFIRNLACDQSGNTLVLFQYVEKHGKPLYELINSKADEGRKVFFVSGETDTSDREAIRRITEKQKDAIIVASLGTFSTGINIRNLHNIIFASPSKSQIKVLQSIGRGLRKSDDGRDTSLFDITDNFQWKSKKNYTLSHGEERVKIYSKERFDYKVVEIGI